MGKVAVGVAADIGIAAVDLGLVPDHIVDIGVVGSVIVGMHFFQDMPLDCSLGSQV